MTGGGKVDFDRIKADDELLDKLAAREDCSDGDDLDALLGAWTRRIDEDAEEMAGTPMPWTGEPRPKVRLLRLRRYAVVAAAAGVTLSGGVAAVALTSPQSMPRPVVMFTEAIAQRIMPSQPTVTATSPGTTQQAERTQEARVATEQGATQITPAPSATGAEVPSAVPTATASSAPPTAPVPGVSGQPGTVSPQAPGTATAGAPGPAQTGSAAPTASDPTAVPSVTTSPSTPVGNPSATTAPSPRDTAPPPPLSQEPASPSPVPPAEATGGDPDATAPRSDVKDSAQVSTPGGVVEGATLRGDGSPGDTPAGSAPAKPKPTKEAPSTSAGSSAESTAAPAVEGAMRPPVEAGDGTFSPAVEAREQTGPRG